VREREGGEKGERGRGGGALATPKSVLLRCIWGERWGGRDGVHAREREEGGRDGGEREREGEGDLNLADNGVIDAVALNDSSTLQHLEAFAVGRHAERLFRRLSVCVWVGMGMGMGMGMGVGMGMSMSMCMFICMCMCMISKYVYVYVYVYVHVHVYVYVYVYVCICVCVHVCVHE